MSFAAAGDRCGQPMIDTLKAKVDVWQQTCSATVAVQEEPFAVAILTPIMARAHAGQWARDVCFVDSTASCDAENHVITFMLTPTVAGAVPLAVIVTDKAYNVVAVVDFTVRVMEDYYRTRLRDFANGRVSAQRLLAEKLQTKASYLGACDQIEDYGQGKYGVPNSDGTELYCVDASLGCCSCRAGLFGKFCKHQLAVMQLFKTAFPNAPGTSPASRHGIAYIALGDSCPPAQFYGDLVENGPADVSLLTMNAAAVASSDTVQHPQSHTADVTDMQPLSIEGTSPDMHPVLADAIGALQQKYNEYGCAPGCRNALQKFTDRLHAVRSSSSLCSLLHNPGLYRRYRAGSMIRVQPTSVSRRQLTVTRGSKKLPAGRPPLTSSGPVRKRRHCLAANVRANVPNAKSHGVGH